MAELIDLTLSDDDTVSRPAKRQRGSASPVPAYRRSFHSAAAGPRAAAASVDDEVIIVEETVPAAPLSEVALGDDEELAIIGELGEVQQGPLSSFCIVHFVTSALNCRPATDTHF